LVIHRLIIDRDLKRVDSRRVQKSELQRQRALGNSRQVKTGYSSNDKQGMSAMLKYSSSSGASQRMQRFFLAFIFGMVMIIALIFLMRPELSQQKSSAQDFSRYSQSALSDVNLHGTRTH
jgi:hypothetical protein